MPKWLEEEITKRKLDAIADISDIGKYALYDEHYREEFSGEEFSLEKLG
jgi:hypothetical protein